MNKKTTSDSTDSHLGFQSDWAGTLGLNKANFGQRIATAGPEKDHLYFWRTRWTLIEKVKFTGELYLC